MRILIDNIISQLIDLQEQKNWVGTNFNERLILISEEEAFIRPQALMHSVAEIISHLTVWRKDAVLKIRTGKGSITDDSEQNWLPNDKLKEIGWDKIKSDYRSSLSELIELLRAREDGFLKEKYYDPDFKGYYEYEFVVHGMLHHDIYHLGQLGIVIKFLKRM
jgi:hypothetical protein